MPARRRYPLLDCSRRGIAGPADAAISNRTGCAGAPTGKLAKTQARFPRAAMPAGWPPGPCRETAPRPRDGWCDSSEGTPVHPSIRLGRLYECMALHLYRDDCRGPALAPCNAEECLAPENAPRKGGCESARVCTSIAAIAAGQPTPLATRRNAQLPRDAPRATAGVHGPAPPSRRWSRASPRPRQRSHRACGQRGRPGGIPSRRGSDAPGRVGAGPSASCRGARKDRV